MKTACRKPQAAEIPRMLNKKASAIVVGFRWSHWAPTRVIPAIDSTATRYPYPDLAAAFTSRLYDKARFEVRGQIAKVKSQDRRRFGGDGI